MVNFPPLGLYLHLPWCIKKCPYCDFNVHKLTKKISQHQYIKHLLSDLDHDIPLISNRIINTIYIGGGTPNLFSPKLIQTLIDNIRDRLPISLDAEITMEANPGKSDQNSFKDYQLAGINRISIGVQSFSEKQLIQLGRKHSVEESRYAARMAASVKLHSFNLDIMYGLPNQSLLEALNDLNEAINFGAPHISWYQLTIEPNTLFFCKKPILPDHDTIWKIYKYGKKILKSSGYYQYEISGYAKPGFQCQHNVNYWRFGDYIGIGCGAHGKLCQKDGKILRTVKTRNPYRYMKGEYLDKQYPISLSELPLEYFMNRFRLLKVVSKKEFRFFTRLKECQVRPALNNAIRIGYITESKNHWKLTKKGYLFLDSLLELLI
ncbi:putative oxygen-independent coproporphyrinogen III oxidase [secondary endosymbiont of Heteropsylla cubana]|uniref:Heme chaperone HemW n=1 Tax=secondary endosymbiont of Heteropsylla cubana TaxID=134287 RepID=J3TGD8_9ENTR|nr:radical SAM family heme chaperone HemW [secondary endosymbiont of Heteropsylla cubana]AFP85477.1 putative oxygen-independent coproporphyrinogen III oxidase [secondary endosymbiont of Heteropsylla cubana]